MNKTLNLKPDIDALCRKAGLDPSSVEAISLTSMEISFTVRIEPEAIGVTGDMYLVTTASFPYAYADDGE